MRSYLSLEKETSHRLATTADFTPPDRINVYGLMLPIIPEGNPIPMYGVYQVSIPSRFSPNILSAIIPAIGAPAFIRPAPFNQGFHNGRATVGIWSVSPIPASISVKDHEGKDHTISFVPHVGRVAEGFPPQADHEKVGSPEVVVGQNQLPSGSSANPSQGEAGISPKTSQPLSQNMRGQKAATANPSKSQSAPVPAATNSRTASQSSGIKPKPSNTGGSSHKRLKTNGKIDGEDADMSDPSSL